MKKKVALTVFLVSLALVYVCWPRHSVITVKGEHYEMDYHTPARSEERLDEWDAYLKPPEGERFVWVYVVMRSVSDKPVALGRADFRLSYRLGQTGVYTTTLVAKGNNGVYMWARDRDYGGITDEDGFGMRYVFLVPDRAQDLVLEITSMPAVPLTVR